MAAGILAMLLALFVMTALNATPLCVGQDNWLNDGAKGYLVGISDGPLLFQAPGIEARALSMEQLLVMKLSAWRDDIDIADARRLLQEVGRARKRDGSMVHRYQALGNCA